GGSGRARRRRGGRLRGTGLHRRPLGALRRARRPEDRAPLGAADHGVPRDDRGRLRGVVHRTRPGADRRTAGPRGARSGSGWRHGSRRRAAVRSHGRPRRRVRPPRDRRDRRPSDPPGHEAPDTRRRAARDDARPRSGPDDEPTDHHDRVGLPRGRAPGRVAPDRHRGGVTRGPDDRDGARADHAARLHGALTSGSRRSDASAYAVRPRQRVREETLVGGIPRSPMRADSRADDATEGESMRTRMKSLLLGGALAGLVLVPGSPAMGAANGHSNVHAMKVYVAYADGIRGDPTIPSPWDEDPGVLFVGSGIQFDAGAIRIVNPSAQPLTIGDVWVAIGAQQYDLW